MLVLSRTLNQSIMIGDDIEVIIVAVDGRTVRVGINAPKHIPVHRKEIHEIIRREKENGGQPPDVSGHAP